MTQNGKPATISDAFRRIPEIKTKPYLVTDRTISYGHLYRHARQFAAFFLEMGIKPGDRIVIASHDDASVILLFLSMLANGITGVIIDPDTPKKRAMSYFRDLDPRAYFIDKQINTAWMIETHGCVFEINVANSKPSLFKKLLRRQPENPDKNNVYPDFLESYSPCDLPVSIDQDSDACIVFTSGTTAAPKGVLITHKSLFSHLSTLSRQFQYDSDSRCLNVTPLFNIDGIVDAVMGTFFNSSILYRPFEFSIQTIQLFLDAIYTYRITHLKTVPTMLALINKFGREYANTFKTEDFKVIYCSGSLLDPKLWKEFQDFFDVRVTNFYGLTETVAGGIFCGADDDSFLMGSIGKPVDCEARIMAPDGSEVETGEIGELILKGDNILKGYLNDSVETDKVLKNGWFYTGDLALKEESGHYRIKGRKKTLIISGGTNILPEEINEILLSHEDVKDAATFGMPDEIWGEIVICGIVPENNSSLAEADIIEYCRNYISPMKMPRKIYFIDAIPRVKSGKIDYTEIKQHFYKNYISKDQETKTSVQDRIIKTAALSFQVPVDGLTLDSNTQNTPEWVSLTHLIFITKLEQEFDIELSTKEIMQMVTLEDAVSIIDKACL